MKYRITKRIDIAGSHELDLPWETPCNRPHGHNWTIFVTCEAEELDHGVVVDFDVIKRLVHEVLDHRHINDVHELPAYVRENPTAEHIGAWVWKAVPYCVKVEVWESRNNRCVVTG
jgi:6-pyruvoyltetrahydropterin/6-carboxytetrahydropterin synthase